MDEQYFEYRTGETHPRKNSRGLIAFLLICVIFLCGVVSVLGLLNIHLLAQLQRSGESPLSFGEGNLSLTAPEGDSLTVAGITVQELSDLHQQVYDLPAGLYVVNAPEGIPVEPGDVLTTFDGTAVTSLEALNALLTQTKTGDRVWFVFSRQGNTFSYTIPLGD
ncbi:MAG: PDZ domain-containing protein [Oscillospiraceae bacterium]|nr:PDZ domain-containing protein [Oscillospiraceae bacterium]